MPALMATWVGTVPWEGRNLIRLRKKKPAIDVFCLLFSLATSILKSKDVHMPWAKTGHQVSNIILGSHSTLPTVTYYSVKNKDLHTSLTSKG